MLESPLRIVARIKAKSDKIEEVRNLLRGLIDPTRKEEGCLTYELLQNRKDPTDFTFVEEWENEAALDNHARSDHILAIGARLRENVAEAPDIRTYTVVDKD